MYIFKRFLYLLYYFKETNFKEILYFLRYSAAKSNKSKIKIIFEIFHNIFIYNISIKDYFCFRFFEIEKQEKIQWAGTGFMFEYQYKMNPPQSRNLLEDKIKFLNYYKTLITRKFADIDELRSRSALIREMLDNSSGRIVLKGSHGQVGAEIEFITCSSYTPDSLLKHMQKQNYDLAEEYVVQHPALMNLSSTGLNTVRVFTQLVGTHVDFLGARLRISVNSPVDNMAAGNLAAPVDMTTGTVNGPAVYSDITKADQITHPVTKQIIRGFIIPYWQEILELTKNVALKMPQNRSVGWDIAITSEGPELIEGNHNWCKLLWQLPVKKGLKGELEKYL